MRLESFAQGDAVICMAFAVTKSTRDRFRRARALAPRRADGALTNGQALRVVTDEYLTRHDPTLTKTRGCANAESAQATPGRRYISAAVKAAVRARSGDRCEVPRCDNRLGLESMHARPVAAGGASTLANIVQGGGDHHVMLDAGLISFLAWDGNGAVFRMPDGSERGERRPRDPPGWQVRERPPTRAAPWVSG